MGVGQDIITMNNTTAVPGNSKIVPVIDSTYWDNQAPWSTTATLPAPGKSRAQLAGRRWSGTVLVTVQNATLKFYVLTNPSGTSNAAWEIDTNGPGGGTITLTAGTTQPFSWLPYTADFMMTITAGATAPTAVDTVLVGTLDRVGS